MDLLNNFIDNVPGISAEELEELAKITNSIDENINSNYCIDCNVPMHINMECSMYICNKCGRSEKYGGETVAEVDVNHKVTISSNGKAYLAADAVTTEESVRRELNEMNMALDNQIHYDIIEKIYKVLVVIRLHIVNRGQVRNSIRAKCTIDVCRKNGVLISDDAINAACGITNKKINDGVRLMDYANMAGIIDVDETDEDETEKMVDTTIKQLDFTANQRDLLVLYIRQHQKLATINRKPMSRIAGALLYMSTVLGMNIEKSDISKLTNVSESTIEQIHKEFVSINDQLLANKKNLLS